MAALTQRHGFRGAALAALAALGLVGAKAAGDRAAAGPSATTCAGDNGGLTLSPGFCATVFADNLGHVRHIAVAQNGVLYANVWSGRYYAGAPVPTDGFLLAVQDTTGNRRADKVTPFGETAADGDHGGTGIALYKGYVYAEANDRIVRYRIPTGDPVPKGPPETVVSGLPTNGDHNMHPIMIDPQGRLFIDLGSATNACQPLNRQPYAPGAEPCQELATRAGLWLYSADKLNQKFSAAGRYVTGLRNGEGLSEDASGRLFATQHGRDQLLQNWPKLFPNLTAATELPAEELVEVRKGDDFGWPHCYYDGARHRLVLAPEYGGDGGKALGDCPSKKAPVAWYPGHWAPNDMVIYKAANFPGPYQGGAFIAFHGSWNRAPAPQAGYDVVFQPLKDGRAAGRYVIFADGFSGGYRDPGRAKHRPTGLAVGPDGALYIADDVKGRIWRVTYQGPRDVAAPSAAPPAPEPSPNVAHVVAASTRPVPPGDRSDQVVIGEKVYNFSTCSGCHGSDGSGTPLGPDLTRHEHLWTDGSLAQITALITRGVPVPKRYPNPMPPMGGAQLSAAERADVAAYVWALGH